MSARRYNYELARRIRDILFYEWNPLCVGPNPNLVDEYDEFIQPLYRLSIEDRALSFETVLRFLEDCEREMEVIGEKNRRVQAAKELCRLLRSSADAERGL